MPKTDLTIEIEDKLREKAKRNSERYAFEVPVPNGICDMVTTKVNYDDYCLPHVTCYEIKVSFNDYYHSKNGANFVGDENYYVMPKELLNEIIKKKANNKFFDVGIITYKNGRFKKEVDGKRVYKVNRLGIENKIKLMDTMLMRILSTGQ